MGVKKVALIFRFRRMRPFEKKMQMWGVLGWGRCRRGSRRHGCQKSGSAPKSDDTGRLPRVKTRSTQNTATLSRLLFQPKIASAKYAFTTFNLHLYIHCE